MIFKQHIQNTSLFHDGKEQGLSLAEESALNQLGIIHAVGENLGRSEYFISQGYSWADVDLVIEELKKKS